MSCTRQDASGAELLEGTLCVGDSGRVYRLLPDQYSSGGDSIRVNHVTMRRGRWTFDEGDPVAIWTSFLAASNSISHTSPAADRWRRACHPN